MNLAETKNLCEEIEIAILSDIELTQEQKDHIDNCESCKALLSQISSMKNDLHEFSVPDIKEGQIADSVMASIKKQKTSVSFPKFKLTHHLGTAAAVAVILVAALVINSPSDIKNNNVSSLDSSDTTPTAEEEIVMENHVLSAAGPKEADTEEKRAVYRTSSDSFHDVPTESADTDDKGSSGGEHEFYFNYSAALGDEYIGKELNLFHDGITPRSISDSVADIVFDAKNANNEAVEEECVEDAVYDAECEAAPTTNIFAGIEFGDNLEENINYANRLLFEFSIGTEDIFEIKFFNPDDFTSNEEFLKAIENFNLNDYLIEK